MTDYQKFLIDYNKYERFVADCFQAYTFEWRGYPGIESIDFNEGSADLIYSVYDDREGLSIPVELIEKGDLAGVVNLWETNARKEREKREAEQLAEVNRRELAEFKRLQAKLGGKQ